METIGQSRPLPLLSLQKWTLVRLTTMLSNNEQLLNLILDLVVKTGRFKARTSNEWKDVLSLANEQLLSICRCDKLNRMILELLWPVSYRIMLWKSTYAFFLEKRFLRHFYWTGRGKIDSLKTAKSVLGDTDVPIRQRFQLACCLCLNEEIRKFWVLMTDDDKVFCRKKIPLVLFWIDQMEANPSIDRFRKHYAAIKDAISLGLLEAVKYFLRIRCLEEHELLSFVFMLITEMENVRFLDDEKIEIYYLLFSKMRQDRKKSSTCKHSLLTLAAILHSSDRNCFINALDEQLRSISTAAIKDLLYMLFHNYDLEVKQDYDYKELFLDVWRRLPDEKKGEIKRDNKTEKHFLKALIKFENRYLLKEKTEDACNSITPYCFVEDRWEFLHILIEKGIITSPFLLEHRNVFLNYLEEKNNLYIS